MVLDAVSQKRQRDIHPVDGIVKREDIRQIQPHDALIFSDMDMVVPICKVVLQARGEIKKNREE